MFAFLAPAALKLLLGRMWGNAKSDIARIPPKVKLALLAAALLVAAFFVHQHVAHKALSDADKGGYDRARAEDAAALKRLRDRAATAAANGAKISHETRTSNEQENLSIHASADALRVRGPGASSCRRVGDPAVPAAGGQPRPPGDRAADAAGALLPDDHRDAVVPWNWLVNRAEQCDLDRGEALSWRIWYQRQAAEWDRLKANGDKPPRQ